MQLVLGKNTLEMNEFTENECLPNLEFLENLRKPLTRKSTRENALALTLKGFSFVCALEQLYENRKRWVLLSWLQEKFTT